MSDQNIEILSKFINYCSIKNQTISRNIANIGTENYKREDVNFNDLFEESMKNQLETDNPRHIKITPMSNNESDFSVVNDSKNDGTNDVNNVNLEQEMGELAKNTLDYRFSTKRLHEYFKLVQSAIKGDPIA